MTTRDQTKRDLITSCAAYIICKVKRCYIRRNKLNESLYKESIADSKYQRTTPDTNTGEFKRPTLQGDQRITTSETKEKRTVTSTDIKRGIVEIDWVNTRHGLDSDGMMNATIGEIQKAIEDDFNKNMRRARRRSQRQHRMVVKPQTRLPQKRRTVRISEKWTKPTRTRLSPPSKHMDCNGAASRLHEDYSVLKFGTAAKIEQRQIKHPQEEDVTVCSSDTHSFANRRQ